MKCGTCGTEVKEGARFCANCGIAVQTAEVDSGETPVGEMDSDEAQVREQYYGFEYCQKCQTRIVDKSDNPNSVLCKQCREEFVHYPIPKWIYFVAAGILVLLLISFVNFPQNLKNYRIVEGAEKRADQGYIFSALNDLNTIAEQNPSSNKVAVKMVDIAMEHGYYDYAAYALNTYLVGEEVSDAIYDRMNNYSEELDRYYNTYDAYEAMFSEVEDTSVDTGEAASEAVIAELKGLLGDSDYDPATAYYYMGYTALDDAERCGYFETCYQMDATYTDAATQAANSYRRAGDLVKARELLTEAYDEDKESPSIIRSLAVIELLDGNPKEGVSLAKSAYELNRDEYYVADTYIIALAASGAIEEARTLKESLEAEGYEFDMELQDFLNGNCTLEEYYIG